MTAGHCGIACDIAQVVSGAIKPLIAAGVRGAGITQQNATIEQGDKSVQQLEAASRGIGLTPALQPIVSLTDGTAIGFEALARWPQLGNPNPKNVFDYAATVGRTRTLNQACARAAIAAALTRPLPAATMVSINCEPQSADLVGALRDVLACARRRLALVFEITEHGLLTHPQELLATVAALRGEGFAVALDDVGAHPDSLALLDIVAPDIIKLDLNLVQSQPDAGRAQVLAAVWAHHERTNAVIVAEGIETDQHVEQAMAMGATLGQGYRFLNDNRLIAPLTGMPAAQVHPPHLQVGSPRELLDCFQSVRSANKPVLNAFSRHIEHQAGNTADPPMVMTALQHATYFTPSTQDCYENLARRSPFVAIFGIGLPKNLGHNVRGVHLDPADPVCAEWTVLALGPQLAVAMIALEHRYDRPPRSDADRRFDFAITYDRTLVTAAAHSLLNRML